ncbi:MAG TPA: type I-E CRISPR-associated protein Cse2/CasB [Candidatus Kapabacteria bacterium]|nr:type I-E CRISPR-associated protein Cse2/CasB [Candidatus Kapabacteria bacterium]
MTDTTMPAPKSRPEDSIDRFIARLDDLKMRGDRAALAKLRRSLVDYGRDFSAYTVLGYALPPNVPPRQLDLYLLVAGLFAMHPLAASDDTSFAWSLRRLRAAREGVGESSLDALAGAILNADGEDIPIRLRHVIARLAADGIPVDYRRLLRDLLKWESVSRHVQRRWARDYYVGRAADGEQPGDAAADGGEENAGDAATSPVPAATAV